VRLSLASHRRLLFVSAAVLRLAFLVWIIEGLAFLGGGLLALQGVLDASRLMPYLLDWITLFVNLQTWAGGGILAAILVRRMINAAPLAPSRFAWLDGVLTFFLLGITLFLRISLGQYEILSQANVLKPEYKVTRSASQPKEWTTVEHVPDSGKVYRSVREAYVQIGMLISAGFLSAIILLFLSIRGFREDREEQPGIRRGSRVPPWRVPGPVGKAGT